MLLSSSIPGLQRAWSRLGLDRGQVVMSLDSEEFAWRYRFCIHSSPLSHSDTPGVPLFPLPSSITATMQETPVTASGRYDGGDWTVTAGSAKIDSVYIEIEGRGGT